MDVVGTGGRAVWQAVNVNLREVGDPPISKGELLGRGEGLVFYGYQVGAGT